MTPWHIAAQVLALPIIAVGVHTVGRVLAEAWERYRIGADIERMMDEENAALLREHEFAEHLMATEWVLREVVGEVEERGCFSWEVES